VSGSVPVRLRRLITQRAHGICEYCLSSERGDSLDISWLKDDSAESSVDLPEPAILATSAMEEMVAIMEDLRGILAELGIAVEEEVLA